MMAYGIYIFSVVIICLSVFVSLPSPPLSERLIEWKAKGVVLSWKENDIFYLNIKGSGKNGDVICLHGFPTSSYDWIKILPDLEKVFNTIVLLDFLGYGFSTKPRNHTYTISEQADIVEHLCHELQIQKAHILAHDYGDTVALELLARSNNDSLPFEMASLTLLNGGIFPEVHHPRPVQKVIDEKISYQKELCQSFINKVSLYHKLQLIVEGDECISIVLQSCPLLLLYPVIGFIASHMFSYPLFCKSLSQVFGENQPTSEDCEDFWALIRYNDGDKASYKVIHFLRERQQSKDRWVGALISTKLRVLMIYGPADPVNPPEFANHFRKTVPNPNIVTLDPTIGHYPQWEDSVSVSKAYKEFIHELK